MTIEETGRTQKKGTAQLAMCPWEGILRKLPQKECPSVWQAFSNMCQKLKKI